MKSHACANFSIQNPHQKHTPQFLDNNLKTAVHTKCRAQPANIGVQPQGSELYTHRGTGLEKPVRDNQAYSIIEF